MKRNILWILMLFFTTLLMVSIQPCWPTNASAEKLPVFKLRAPQADQAQADRILVDLHKGKVPGQVQKLARVDAHISQVGKRMVEVHKASGAVFVVDSDRLWNPAHRPTLLSQKQSRTIADGFLAKNRLMSAVDGKHSRVNFDSFSETKALSNVPGSQVVVLDTQVNYKVEVNVNRGGRAVALPVVGGGGKFKVAVGDRGDIVGFHGNWRGIDRVQSEEEIIPQQEAEKRFRSAQKNLNLSRVESSLAYFSAPPTEKQDVLAPVWVIKASAKIGDQEVPLRNAIIAATKYGPSMPIEQQQAPRDVKAPLPAPLKDGRQQGSLDLISSAWADAANRTFGVEFIGVSGGLAQSAANAAGFRNTMIARGWTSKFYYGDANAWESDWRKNNNSYVDNVDIVFYTGHANSWGWVLSPPEDNFLSDAEVRAKAPDLYGNNNLDWLIIAACGPMQDPHFTSGINSAFDRWGKIFNGLRVFMGYGAVTYDQSIEGRRVAELATQGWPIIDAWFRAAWEAQPTYNNYGPPNGPRIWVTAMYVDGWRYDRIWGAGATLPKPPPGRPLWLMWSGT